MHRWNLFSEIQCGRESTAMQKQSTALHRKTLQLWSHVMKAALEKSLDTGGWKRWVRDLIYLLSIHNFRWSEKRDFCKKVEKVRLKVEMCQICCVKWQVDLGVYFGGWVGGAWMSLGVSDNVLLEAHSDGQNSQHPKLTAQKIGQHSWSFWWTIISILVATLRRTASNCIHKLNVDGQQILGEKWKWDAQHNVERLGGGENSES